MSGSALAWWATHKRPPGVFTKLCLLLGLFHRAVAMSGSALAWWASLKRPMERAQKLAKLVDCNDKEELVKCLR